jgi:hypothetical protein
VLLICNRVANIVSFEAIPDIIDETSYSDSESKSEMEGGFEKSTKETVVVSTTPKKYKV